MLTPLHKWYIDRSVRTGRPAPALTRRAEARDPALCSFRARLAALEPRLRADADAIRARPSPRTRQAVLDAAADRPRAARAPATRRMSGRIVLPLGAIAVFAVAAVPTWVAFHQHPSNRGLKIPPPLSGGIASNDTPAPLDTGIAAVLSARREISPATPLLEEARRLAADTRAVRDGLLARIPLIHASAHTEEEPAGNL